MGASAVGALLFGLLFDRRGMIVLIPSVLIGAATTPLAFAGGATAALIGTILWGLATGTQNALMSASVAKLVPESQRARAYGLFSAIYGVSWFAGSALLGVLYDRSTRALVIVAVLAQIAALVPLILAIRAQRR
jgi:predicted MFS family arabinose efflux permease